LDNQFSGVTQDFQTATSIAASMIGYYGMDDSLFSYLAVGGQGVASGDMKPRIEALLKEQYRQVKTMLDHNKEAITAIAEALILRNELTDIDVNEILARVEAEHPFISEAETKKQPFGFASARALPDPTPSRRGSRRTEGIPAPVEVPVAQQPSNGFEKPSTKDDAAD
jgi:cell division protease FtsH